MIGSFFESWSLFRDTYLAGWGIGLVLSMIGVIVVARDQIFIGAAIAQASTLGIALAIWLPGFWLGAPHALESDVFAISLAVVLSIAAALLTSRGGVIGRESHEAITGWVFLISASLSILILAHSPHGLEEIHRLVSSSIIGATSTDVAVFAGLTLLAGLAVLRFSPQILLFATDPGMAGALGMKVARWNAATALSLGLAVGLSIRISGLLYTFGCLVLPALIAKNWSREMRPIFWMAPAIVWVCGALGFALANHYDFPPAQMTIALLSGLLGALWLARWLRALSASR